MRVLDLFCGAGGAAMGLHQAGFEVVGVDIKPQPHYPFEFHQADALTWSLEGFDVYWASPPCQDYSSVTRHLSGKGKYPRLIDPIRELLTQTSKPYVIENVVGAPLVNPIMLCGAMFGAETYRHRLFESSVWLMGIPHSRHMIRASPAGHWKPGTFVSVAGNCAPIALARKAMGIDWMTRDELSEAIPPAYSRFIGEQLMKRLNGNR